MVLDEAMNNQVTSLPNLDIEANEPQLALMPLGKDYFYGSQDGDFPPYLLPVLLFDDDEDEDDMGEDEGFDDMDDDFDDDFDDDDDDFDDDDDDYEDEEDDYDYEEDVDYDDFDE